jgi:hypothetical protein
VKDFGAKGDGVTDDLNAINNAIADAQTNHKVLFFPGGTYLHSGIILFNGVVVLGSGASSVLYATNSTGANAAVILAGTNVSIQNIVISTAGLTGGSSVIGGSTFVVADAYQFTVKNNTFVQGAGRIGVLVQTSSTGTVTSCTCDGTGNSADWGAYVAQSSNVSIVGNLFQNEAIGLYAAPTGSKSIAVLSNTIGNVSFPTSTYGVLALGVSTLDIAQNTIQMVNSSNGAPIFVNGDDAFSVSENNTYGGQIGVAIAGAGSSGNSVTQNTIHNCGVQGIATNNSASTAIQIASNQFGECGMFASGPSLNNAVILVEGTDASGTTTFVQNNSYQGHLNGLTSKVTCTFTAPHIPAANVTGNTQTQTVLNDHI